MIVRVLFNLVVLLKIIEVFFIFLSFFLSLFFLFFSIVGMSSFRWARLVNLWLYFFSKGRRVFIFVNVIFFERKDSIILKRNSRIFVGNVDSYVFFLLFFFCKYVVIVWFFDLFFVISDRFFSCFLDLICFSIEFFFLEIISL